MIIFDHQLTSVQSPQWFWYHLCLSNSISILMFIFAIFSKLIILEFFAQLIVKCVSVMTSHCHWIRDQPKVFSAIVVNDFPTLSDSHWFKCPNIVQKYFPSIVCEIAFSEFDFQFWKLCSKWVLEVRVDETISGSVLCFQVNSDVSKLIVMFPS